VVFICHFVTGGLHQYKLCLGLLVLDEGLHTDDIHVVLLVMGQEIVVQLQRRYALTNQQNMKADIFRGVKL
jgi:hypothetical protein